LRDLVFKLDKIRDSKIPFYEKLPKDSSFYKHYMHLLYTRKIDQVADTTAKEDRYLLRDVGDKITKPLNESKIETNKDTRPSRGWIGLSPI
jgi:hypothetical protein